SKHLADRAPGAAPARPDERGLGDQLPRIHDAERVERMLDRAKRMDPAGGSEPLELAELQLADAVLGRDRASGGSDEIVDELRDLGPFALIPVGRSVAGRADVEVDVAVPQMPEPASDHAGEAALDLSRGLDDEARHVSHPNGDVVSERLAFCP